MAQSFTDRTGIEWKLEVNYSSAVRLKNEADYDVQQIFSKNDAGSLFSDLFKLGSVLWVLVAEQADKLGINQEQFAQRLDGDALEDASIAFMKAVIDFFPRARRSALDAGLRKLIEVDAMVSQKMIEKINSRELSQEIEDVLSGRKSASSLQGSLA